MLLNSKKNKDLVANHFFKLLEDGRLDQNLFEKTLIECNFKAEDGYLMFDSSLVNLVNYIVQLYDEKLVDLAKKNKLDDLSVSQKVKKLILLRLQLIAENKIAAQKIWQFYFDYHNSYYGAKTLYKTCDLIWKIAKDSSTDYNFYTKRAILAKVYLKVFKFYLDDFSQNDVDTINCLDEELKKVARIGKIKAQLKDKMNKIDEICQKLPKSINDLPFFRLYKKK